MTDLELGNKLSRKARVLQLHTEQGSLPYVSGVPCIDIGNKYLMMATDGVGNKIDICNHNYNDIGIDLVAMCVNDLIRHGFTPSGFSVYYAQNYLNERIFDNIMQGVAYGCLESRCSLIAGETAEMPDHNGISLAGTAIGTADKELVFNWARQKDGDVLVGIPSNGLHSNGFSYIKNIMLSNGMTDVDDLSYEIGFDVMKPTRIYSDVLDGILFLHDKIYGGAHITGGGLIEKVGRMLYHGGLTAIIYKSKLNTPGYYNHLEKLGKISKMYNIFNMGIGMVYIVDKNSVSDFISSLLSIGILSHEIGHIQNRIYGPSNVIIV